MPYYKISYRKDTDMVYDLQKASMWKRASAYIFDFILICIVAVGVCFLLSTILGYDAHIEKMEAAYSSYEEKYGIDLDISAEDFEKLSDEEKAIYKAADEEFSKDPELQQIYTLLVNYTLIITTFGVLAAYLLLEILVPLLFKNGQTVGKKVFGVAVMRVDGVKLSAPLLFVRAILGKYTIETMFPVLLVMMAFFTFDIVSVVVILLFVILQIVVISVSKTNSAIHDLISGTVAVDMSSQLIFNSPEELMEYKKRLHAEAADKAAY